METQFFIVRVAEEKDHFLASTICNEMEASAQARGTGIAKRSPEYIEQKMSEGKAIIALTDRGEWAGFCYVETWGHGKYVANSGLIVSPAYRNGGLAKKIKEAAFQLSRNKYPEAKLFGLTTNSTVMSINSDLGYRPVTFSHLTDDAAFWAGCRSCVNYPILESKQFKNCLCTAMLFDPAKENARQEKLPVATVVKPKWNGLKQIFTKLKTAIV